MKDIKEMVKEMEMVNFIIKREVIMMVIGKIIEWMGMELSTILMEKLLIKENGRMTNFMGKELSSMISQLP
jgi:hypothetical protein